MDAEKIRPSLLNNHAGSKRRHVEAAIVDLKEQKNVTWKDIKPQILMANVTFLITMQPGINIAFPNLIRHDFDTNASSWIASIVGLSTPFGACASGVLMDKYGRKTTNIINVFPLGVSWLLTAIVQPDQLWLLLIARFLAGISSGLTISNMVYVSEISHKKYRPVLLSLLSVYFSLGILLTTVLAWFFSWRQCSVIYAVLFIALTILLMYSPESPIWLLNFRGDWINAKVSLRQLYSNDEVFNSEWHYLIEVARDSQANLTTKRQLKLSNPIVYKPVVALGVIFLLQQLSGIYESILYATLIFPAVSPHMAETISNEAFILFGVIRLLSSIAGSLMSVHMGRKTLLLTSSLGMAVSSLLIICSVYLRAVIPFHETLALFLFFTFVATGGFGVMTMPWTLVVELLPTEVKSIGSTILVSYGYLLISVFAKIFPFVLDAVGPGGVFAFFGAVSISLAIYSYLFIPETLGKTFQEIEQYFQGK